MKSIFLYLSILISLNVFGQKCDIKTILIELSDENIIKIIKGDAIFLHFKNSLNGKTKDFIWNNGNLKRIKSENNVNCNENFKVCLKLILVSKEKNEYDFTLIDAMSYKGSFNLINCKQIDNLLYYSYVD